MNMNRGHGSKRSPRIHRSHHGLEMLSAYGWNAAGSGHYPAVEAALGTAALLQFVLEDCSRRYGVMKYNVRKVLRYKHAQVYVRMDLAISPVTCPELHIARGSKMTLPLCLQLSSRQMLRVSQRCCSHPAATTPSLLTSKVKIRLQGSTSAPLLPSHDRRSLAKYSPSF